MSFALPPLVKNGAGETRKAGFELEYAGVSIEESARLVQKVFGGEITVLSTFQQRVDAPAGKFKVEIDTSLLKDKKYEKPLRAIGVDPDETDLKWLENALLETMATIIPIEIAAPPLPIDALEPLEKLRGLLHHRCAKGTKASILYAFGMHINPEIPTDDAGVLRDYLRAFVLLYPWLKERAEVDLTRQIAPYVKSFPDEYVKLILRDDYPASRERLIDDYLAHNATRNRALDMLPVLAHLDKNRVMRQVEEKHLVKARPAFHYRLPNCSIDDPDWTLAGEWNIWVAVERLANDPERLAEMSRDYLAADAESFKPFIDKWPDVLASYMGS